MEAIVLPFEFVCFMVLEINSQGTEKKILTDSETDEWCKQRNG